MLSESCVQAGIADVPFFESDGKTRTMTCHDENQRHHTQVIKEWALSVVNYGFTGVVRGTPIAIEPPPGSQGPLRLIAAGSMMQACYLAFDMAPQNPCVVHTRKITDTSQVWARLVAPLK
jgi:hypothetical protein